MYLYTTPIDLIYGDDPLLAFTLLDGETDDPFDLTGYTSVTAIVKAHAADADADAIAAISGVITGATADGTVEVDLPGATFTAPGRYVYRLLGVKSGRDKTLARGPIQVIAA